MLLQHLTYFWVASYKSHVSVGKTVDQAIANVYALATR